MDEGGKILRGKFGVENKKGEVLNFSFVKSPEMQDRIRMQELAGKILVYIKGIEGIEIFPKNDKFRRAKEYWESKEDVELMEAVEQSSTRKWGIYPEHYLALAEELKKRAGEDIPPEK